MRVRAHFNMHVMCTNIHFPVWLNERHYNHNTAMGMCCIWATNGISLVPWAGDCIQRSVIR